MFTFSEILVTTIQMRNFQKKAESGPYTFGAPYKLEYSSYRILKDIHSHNRVYKYASDRPHNMIIIGCKGELTKYSAKKGRNS